MTKSTKVALIQFVSFAFLFLLAKLTLSFTDITGILNAIICGVVALLLAPQFKVIRTQDGEKVYMRWLFSKKAKELDW